MNEEMLELIYTDLKIKKEIKVVDVIYNMEHTNDVEISIPRKSAVRKLKQLLVDKSLSNKEISSAVSKIENTLDEYTNNWSEEIEASEIIKTLYNCYQPEAEKKLLKEAKEVHDDKINALGIERTLASNCKKESFDADSLIQLDNRTMTMRIETTQDWKYEDALKRLTFKPGIRYFGESANVVNYLQSENYLYLTHNLSSYFLRGTGNNRKGYSQVNGTVMLRVDKKSPEYIKFFKDKLTDPMSIITDDFINNRSYVRRYVKELDSYEEISYQQAEQLIKENIQNKNSLYYHVKLPILKKVPKTSK